MAAKRTRTPMSDEHKAALAEGRNQGRAVRRYLEALDAHKPKRGRKRTPESMQKRLDRIDVELAVGRPAQAPAAHPGAARPPARARARPAPRSTSAGSSRSSCDAAAAYSERKGISYAAWRELGVEPAVLKRAGISRAS